MKTLGIIFLAGAIFFGGHAHAFLGLGTGTAQIAQLGKILEENIRRYKQLKKIIGQNDGDREYLRILNEGINNAEGLLRSLPLENGEEMEGIKKIQNIYGEIPRSEEYDLRLLHDKTVSEGFELARQSDRYTKRQERNADRVFEQARKASPKGAQRMSAQTGAQILHSLNRLIKLNSRMLKLQGQQLAYNNKRGKDSAVHFNRINGDVGRGFQGMNLNIFRGVK